MRGGAPNGYSIIQFDGHRYSIRFKAARRPADHQMNIFTADATTSETAAETEVLVNVFSGSERTRVEMRLGENGDWTPLRGKPAKTPTTWPPSRAISRETHGPDFFPATRHRIAASVGGHPARESAAGTYAIEVRATDMYGQVFNAHIA